jgi:hypothetical protein
MNKDSIDDISALIQEKVDKIYDTALTMANLRLLNYYRDEPKKWKSKQLSDVSALKREVSSLVKKEVQPLFSTIDKAFLLLGAVAGGTFKGMDDIDAKEIKVNITKGFEKNISKFKKQVAKDLNKLPDMIARTQRNNINKVGMSLADDPRIKTLYDGILKQTEMGIDNSPKVSYNDGRFERYEDGKHIRGRLVNFPNYMDMNVRTTIQQVGNGMQEEAGREAGLIFWLCSTHGDCANDHADYQGKIYVDEDWASMVGQKDFDRVYNYISSNKIETKQDVENNDPYLCTRPNCRHYFMPLSIDEVLSESKNDLLKERGMIKGKYDSEKYQNLQKQRYEERNIRKYKQRLEQNELAMKKLPNGEEKDKLQKLVMKDKQLVKNHQAKVRTLIKEHPYLDRDYDRENPRIVRNDLGVRFNLKYKEK